MFVAGALLTGGAANLLRAQDAVPGEQPAAQVLRATWADADHASGVYYAKASGNVQVIVENPSDEPQTLEGSIAFGEAGKTAGDFKALSITPIAATTLAARERVKIPLAVAFSAAGRYELQWVHGDKTSTVVDGPAGIMLHAIFAPRAANGADAPWITTLPPSTALVPGYIGDLAAQTAVHRFLLDERFEFDPATNIALGFGASLQVSAEQIRDLFVQMAKARTSLVLRVTVPIGAGRPGAKALQAFHQYIGQACTQGHGVLGGVVVAPEPAPPATLTAEQRAGFREYYLAAYQEAKKRDKDVMMLGAGSAQATQELLLMSWTGADGKAEDLRAYLDALAISDTIAQPVLTRAMRGDGPAKLPLWILPPASADPWPMVPTAAALAQEAGVVPVPPPGVDRGVAVHLLGGTVFFQQLHPQNIPYVAMLQGDGYAVAAIAGLGAGTPLDAAFPGLAHTKTTVIPAVDDQKPAYANTQVPDDTRSLRVVDASGAAVNCREGDELFIPVNERIVYLLQTGNADDLAALLRPAATNRLPMMEITAAAAVITEGDAKKPAITLHLTNVTLDEIGGTVKIILPPAGETKSPVTLAQNPVVPISPGKSLELTLPLAEQPPARPLIVEISTDRATQRTAIVLRRE